MIKNTTNDLIVTAIRSVAIAVTVISLVFLFFGYIRIKRISKLMMK